MAAVEKISCQKIIACSRTFKMTAPLLNLAHYFSRSS